MFRLGIEYGTVSDLQKTIIGWPAVVQYFIDVYCREARRFYEIESEGFLNDASCYILKEVFYELCPAGMQADIYEADNEGFLMPKLLYFEGVVL